jgi:hypothetical protein
MSVIIYFQNLRGMCFDARVGFRWDRGTIDDLFSTFVGLSKRQEHGLETWALFIDLVNVFDSISSETLVAISRRLGLPDHFVKLLSRLDSSLGWSRCSYAHEPGTTADADKSGSAFSAGRLLTDDVR